MSVRVERIQNGSIHLCNSCGSEIDEPAIVHECTALFHRKCLPSFLSNCPKCEREIDIGQRVGIVSLENSLDWLCRLRFNHSVSQEEKQAFLTHIRSMDSEAFDKLSLIYEVMEDLSGNESIEIVAKRHAAFADLLFIERIKTEVNSDVSHYTPTESEIRESLRGFSAQFRPFFLWILRRGDERMRIYISAFRANLTHSPNFLRSLERFRKIYIDNMTRLYCFTSPVNRNQLLERESDEDLKLLQQDPSMHNPARLALLRKKERRHKDALKMVALAIFILFMGAVLAYSKRKS